MATTVAAMSGCKWPALQSLDLSDNYFYAHGLTALFKTCTIRPPDYDLKRLLIGGMSLDAKATAVLAKSTWQLQFLDISCMGL